MSLGRLDTLAASDVYAAAVLQVPDRLMVGTMLVVPRFIDENEGLGVDRDAQTGDAIECLDVKGRKNEKQFF